MMELAMKIFIRTILLVVCLFAVFTSPVKADDVLDPGDIAIIGFNSDDTSQFSFVCLKEITSGTIIYFTDNGWILPSNTFRSGEGRLTWNTPGGCQLGQIVTINQYDLPTIGNFQLSNGGDQILVYQGSDENPSFIFAINFEESDWQGSASTANKSARPFGLDATNSVALVEIDNSIYTGSNSFTTTADALAAIVNKDNWKGSNDVRQIMPSGSFFFTTTAVHLSDLSAETGSETPPWWVLLGLVIVPVLLMIFKRPKRDFCK
jgi:hypothetical protein